MDDALAIAPGVQVGWVSIGAERPDFLGDEVPFMSPPPPGGVERLKAARWWFLSVPGEDARDTWTALREVSAELPTRLRALAIPVAEPSSSGTRLLAAVRLLSRDALASSMSGGGMQLPPADGHMQGPATIVQPATWTGTRGVAERAEVDERWEEACTAWAILARRDGPAGAYAELRRALALERIDNTCSYVGELLDGAWRRCRWLAEAPLRLSLWHARRGEQDLALLWGDITTRIPANRVGLPQLEGIESWAPAAHLAIALAPLNLEKACLCAQEALQLGAPPVWRAQLKPLIHKRTPPTPGDEHG